MQRKYRITLLIVVGMLLVSAARMWILTPAGGEFLGRLATRGQEDVWPSSRSAYRSGMREVMGTFARITAVCEDEKTAREAIVAAFDRLDEIEQLMSYHLEDSELSMLNRAGANEAVEVSDELFELLERSVYFSEISGGAFDVTVGPMIELWKSAKEKGEKPTAEEIAEAKSRVGFEKLGLDAEKKTVTFAVDGMRVDLGAIAKGYAIDEAVGVLKAKGVMGGMVDVGGDIRCFGAPPEGARLWVIGLQDPRRGDELPGGGESVLVKFSVLDEAVATSGDYRRFVVVDGEKQSHIIDPHTAKGADELNSVTIIAEDALTADALATMVSVMGDEAGLAVVEEVSGAEAYLVRVDKDGENELEVLKTAGIDEFIGE